MNSNLLKELLKLYSQLPCGMMVFKDTNLYFLNNHLRNILTLGNLPIEDSLDTIASMLQISPSGIDLFNFFTKKPFFNYKEKHIQISHKKYEEYEIFVFMKLDESVLSELFINFKEVNKITMKDIKDSQTNAQEEEKEDSKILEYFNKHHNVKTTGTVLYNGIPLISENIILKTYKNSLAVKIEDKQMICSKIGVHWIIKTAKNVVFQAIVKNTDNDKKLIFLSNPKIIKDGFDKRECIRYELDPHIPFIVTINNVETVLDTLDLSENSLKIRTDNATILEALSNSENIIQAKVKLKDETINLSCKFLREGRRYDSKAEIIFLFTPDNNSKPLLKKWLNDQQLKAIQEIRAFKDNPISNS
jgi:hypothetical protein